jgi:hypothetical protein
VDDRDAAGNLDGAYCTARRRGPCTGQRTSSTATCMAQAAAARTRPCVVADTAAKPMRFCAFSSSRVQIGTKYLAMGSVGGSVSGVRECREMWPSDRMVIKSLLHQKRLALSRPPCCCCLGRHAFDQAFPAIPSFGCLKAAMAEIGRTVSSVFPELMLTLIAA